MAVIFETERLIARDWNPELDAVDAFEMYSDPEVMRFLGREPQLMPSVVEQKSRLEARVAAMAGLGDGTGFWALECKNGGQVVGAILVKWLPDGEGTPTEDLEIGWHLKQKAWGKGYATEAGKAAVRYAFDTLNAGVLNAVVFKENTRSIAVTQRLGMIPMGPTDKYYGVTVELFQLRREF